MKCLKCEKETNDHSKFCSNCGEKVEERSSVMQLEDTVKMCSKVWYILGYMKGVNRDDKKSLEEFEKALKNCQVDIWDWYQEVVNYWKEWALENNEKDKKADGSKRVRVPKAERAKTQSQ